MKSKEDIIAFIYKALILGIITSQIYMIICEEINFFTLVSAFVMIIYLVFRFYLLFKLSRDATKMGIPFSEFLKTRCLGCREKSENCTCNKL